MKFRVGDKVKVYGYFPSTDRSIFTCGYTLTGFISTVKAVRKYSLLVQKPGSRELFVHPKQCRKLKKVRL